MTQAEKTARENGWISEFEFNCEHDGVRHPDTGNWAEDWEGACAQIESWK